MSRRFRQAFVETICRRNQTQECRAPDATQRRRSTVAVVRGRHHSFATEMLPSHQQQQLLAGNVYVDTAGKLTAPHWVK